TILALLVTVAMMASTFAVLGTANAATPQTGQVTINMDFVHDGTFAGFAKTSTTATITTLSGQYVTSISGPVSPLNLTLGHYYVNAQPQVTFIAGLGSVITNSTHYEINVTGSSNYTVNISATTATPEHFNVADVQSGSSANLVLTTTSGFNFFKTTVYNNGTSAANESFNATAVPENGPFYVNLTYEESGYSMLEGYNPSGLNINLTGNGVVNGVVSSKATGSHLSPVNIVILNTKNNTYQVEHFSTYFFTIASNNHWANQTLLVSSPGYQSWEISNPASTPDLKIMLNKSTSDINYTYNLSSNPKYLNLSVGYYITNGTTIPTFGNSSVNSLYWQEKMDVNTLTPQSFKSYLSNLSLSNTANTIDVNGYIYSLTGKSTPSASVVSGASPSVTGNVTFYYTNSSITVSSVSSGFTVHVHTLPTKYLSGTVSYNYTFKYSYSNLSLTSSSISLSSFVQLTNPVYIPTPTSNQTVSMTFSKAKTPVITDSDISLHWKNMVSSNYVLNSSLNNTLFAIPLNTSVSFNASGAYLNPSTSTGSNDYLKAHFSWYSLSSTYSTNSSYNATFLFNKTGTFKIDLTVTSPQNITNTTQFNVTVVNSLPSVQYNISLRGKSIVTGSGNQTNVSVPQSALLQFSGYKSVLTASGYKVPLIYTWYLPSYSSSAMNVTYSFTTPYIKNHALQTGFLNITSVVGTYSNVSFNFYVNDTTPPSPVISLTNATGVAITQPVAGQTTYFSANTSSDAYYPESSLVYHWKIMYTNGTVAAPGSQTYKIVAGGNNTSYIGLVFNNLDGLTVSLNATNPSHVSGYSNKTYLPIVDTSRLVVEGVYFPGALSQGSRSTVYVNVSNNGTSTANNFTIYVYVNNKVVASQFYNRSLAPGSTLNLSFNMTPGASGNIPFEFEASSSPEPSFYAALGAFTSSHSVNPPAYRTPLIIGVVIAIIVVVGIVYYKISSGGTRETKTTAIKKADQKKTPPQKKQ
ncbi:MAG: CARDB domain-containing protein, partial [Thermoplasmataceae archaeon]